MKTPAIDILVSTYDGEKYLSRQLDSLLSQSFKEFRVLIRDDGSRDNTLNIIKEYSLSDERIIHIKDDKGNIGSNNSFFELLEHSTSEYIMFCDQDDVWFSDKIKRSYEAIVDLSKRARNKEPLLVFGDLEVVDSELNLLNRSFWSYQKLMPKIAYDWKKLLAQNVVTGCTMIFNNSSKEYLLPFLLKDMIHDHYVAVNIAKHGKVDYIDAPLLKYRQHSSNVLGANRFDLKYIIKKIKDIKSIYNKFKSYIEFFKDISMFELIYYKITINLKRLNKNR